MCPGGAEELKLISAGMHVPQRTPFNTALISPTLSCGLVTPFGENWTMRRVTEWKDHINFRRRFLREKKFEFPTEDRLVEVAAHGMQIRVTVNLINQGTHLN